MWSLNDIERLPERAARIAAYRELLTAQPGHSLAWFNLAVHELDDGDRLASRRAALQALALDEGLRAQMPDRLRAQLEVDGYRLVREVHAGTTQVLYLGRRADDTPVYLRSLRDRPHALAMAGYQAHAAVPSTAVELVVAMGTVAVAGAETFQVLEHQPGRPVGQLLHGDGPARGFGVEEVPRIDGEVAATVALEVLEQMSASRHELDPNPDLWLRTARGVISLGPPGWSQALAWMAPEERDPDADDARVAVYRAALLVWVALTGKPPPPLDTDDRRALVVEELPPRYQAVGPTLTAAVDPTSAGRPKLTTLIDRLRAVTTSSISGAVEQPREIAGYRLVRPLGEGGFGTVYEGLGPQGERVAVKVLHPHLALSPEARARFFHQAKLTTTIDHPNVVRTLASGSKDGTDFVVMELVEGESLDRYLARSTMTPREAVRLGRDVAGGVGALHTGSQAMIHRDLKPANVMLEPREAAAGEPRWRARVCDFGIARLLGDPTDDGLPYTRTGQWNGTPAYMAPEQWRQDPLDERVDVYALGCMLYEALTGQPPFRGKPYELLEAHLHAPPPPLPATVPPRLAAAIMKMLAKAPDDRFASMAEVEATLAEPAILEPAATPVTTTTTTATTTTPPTTTTTTTPPVTTTTKPDEGKDTRPPTPTTDGKATTTTREITRPHEPHDEPRRSGWRRAMLPLAVVAGVGAAVAITVVALGDGDDPKPDVPDEPDPPPPPPPPPARATLELQPALRSALEVIGWSADGERFAAAIEYRDPARPAEVWNVIAEYDARNEAVLRWWDRSAPTRAVTAGEPSWGPRVDAPWSPADVTPGTVMAPPRLAVDFCAPASPRKAPVAIDVGPAIDVRWDRVSPLPPVPCDRAEDSGLVVVRDRDHAPSRLLRYAYKPDQLPGRGRIVASLSPDGRRVAVAVVDRSDDGAAAVARVYARISGPQVKLVVSDEVIGRRALLKLRAGGVDALLSVRPGAQRRVRYAAVDGEGIARRAASILHLTDVALDAAADSELTYLDAIVELGGTR